MAPYSAVVTTTPFLVIAFLLELRVLGPVAHRRRRQQRRVDRATDHHAVLLLAVGFAAALVGLLFELDHWALRTLAALPLGTAGAVLFAAVRADLDTRYDTPDLPVDQP